MTFLAPAFLLAAGAVAVAVAVLHFLATRDPKTTPLPTARFAPELAMHARVRAVRLQDRLLLLVRVGLILAVGAALAGPVLRPTRHSLVRILLVDRSRAVASAAEVADSVLAFRAVRAVSASDGTRGGARNLTVVFDSAATLTSGRAPDSLMMPERSVRRGRLTPALVAALRLASAMREEADSFELAIISPFAVEEFDDATDSVRALWPGAVRLVRVGTRNDASSRPVIAFDGASDDPLRYALPPARGAATARVVRGAAPSSADSAFARSGHVLVYWPRGGDRGGAPAPPAGWTPRKMPDTVGAIVAGGVVVVAPFTRYATLPLSHSPTLPLVVARWVDGDPAAIEEPAGAGCMRTVAVGVPSLGDLVLQPRFTRFVEALAEPCGGAPALAPAGPARLASLAGPARSRAAGRAFAVAEIIASPWATWLLLAALALAATELALRRERPSATAGQS